MSSEIGLLLIDRKPFSREASKIFSYSETNLIECFVSSLSFSNVYFVLRKLEGKDRAIGLLKQLEKIVKITPVDENIIRKALLSEMKDFEDAIQNYSAEAENI